LSSEPVLLAELETFGGRYQCTFAREQFVLLDRGKVLEPVRTRSDSSDGDTWGFYLCHPDDDFGGVDWAGGTWTTPGQAHELAYGRSARVAGVTITEVSRTVYSNKGVILPAKHRAPLEDRSAGKATGPGVLIGKQVHLVDDLWTRAWAPGGLRVPGQGSGDDDGYEPARPTVRLRRKRRSRGDAPPPFESEKSYPTSQRGRMGVEPGKARGRMGQTDGKRGHMGSGSRGRMGRG
jgi:hypothetical protein